MSDKKEKEDSLISKSENETKTEQSVPVLQAIPPP